MSILLGFAPFITFFVVMRAVSPAAGLGAAFLVSLLYCARDWWRGGAVKVLEIGSFTLFGVLAFYTLALRPHWSVGGVRLVVDAGLLAITLVSLAIGRPFTLQYARERVPRELWHLPRFMTVNRIITTIWGGAFAVLVAADASMVYLPQVPEWIDWAVTVVALAAAIRVTTWYAAMSRRAVAALGTTGAGGISNPA